MKKYKYAVIGNGLMGSAAGRYLSKWSDGVAIIGPSEPADHAVHDGVFSSHYDQGRLTREFSQDPIWAVVTGRAVHQYADIETQSGLPFHVPVGRVHAGRRSADDEKNLVAWMQRVDPNGEAMRYFPASDRGWEPEYPYLSVPEGFGLFHERGPAGYVNPREMLRAQNAAAVQHGAITHAGRVEQVQSNADGVLIRTATGEQIAAERVLVACGAFTNFSQLLPDPIPLRLKTESMVWGEVSAETAARLSAMPGVGFDIEGAEIDDIYMAPPILYPDGTYKIKMGCNTANELWPTTLGELQAWFQRGASDLDLPAMEAAFRDLLPDVEFLGMTSHRCIVTYTPSGYPTIDRVPSDPHGRLFVATGGNGSGAGGSDTLGLLAAGLMFDGRWIDALPRDLFLATNEWGMGKDGPSKAQARAMEKSGG